MAIQSIGGGATLITGKGIDLFRLVSLKGRIKMEGLGLKSSVNCTAAMMREFGIPGRATKKNRELVLAKMEERIAEIKQSVALENMALSGENN